MFYYFCVFNKDEFCEGKKDGLYKDEDDCQAYFNCAHEITYKYSCPDGTLFNAQAKYCDWKANVDCDDEVDDSMSGKMRMFIEWRGQWLCNLLSFAFRKCKSYVRESLLFLRLNVLI